MSHNAIVPEILNDEGQLQAFPLVESEVKYLSQAASLLKLDFPDHSLNDLWNAALNNLQRRIEAYGVDLFESTAKGIPGRKDFRREEEHLHERWANVDSSVVVEAASQLGVVSRKAAKTLETINWMRNHASAAHGNPDPVTKEDVLSIALLLQKNLFEHPLPDPGHSVGAIFEPVKSTELGADELDELKTQIKEYKQKDLRTCFGFLLDLLSKGEEPALSNAQVLLPVAWDRAGEDLRKMVGERFHTLTTAAKQGDDVAQETRTRVLEFLTDVAGIKYIPPLRRAGLYRRAAKKLAQAKDEHYGWASERAAAKTLAQYGPHVPKGVTTSFRSGPFRGTFCLCR